MITLKFKPSEPENSEIFRWQDDVNQIVNICYKHGYIISTNDARLAWEAFSESMCAGWLILFDDEQVILESILEHCTVE